MKKIGKTTILVFIGLGMSLSLVAQDAKSSARSDEKIVKRSEATPNLKTQKKGNEVQPINKTGNEPVLRRTSTTFPSSKTVKSVPENKKKATEATEHTTPELRRVRPTTSPSTLPKTTPRY